MTAVDTTQALGQGVAFGMLSAGEGATEERSATAAPRELDHALGVLHELVGRSRSESSVRPKELGTTAQSARTVGAAATSAPEVSDLDAASVEDAETDPEPPPVADVIPDDLRGLILQASGDPVLCLALLNAAMSSMGVQEGLQDVRQSGRNQQDATLERQRAIDKAIKRAARRCHMPTWLRTLVKAIATIASAVVAAMSGGAGVVALVGMVLLLSAEHIGKLAVKLGMDPSKAKWLVVGLQAVGAAMSLVAGGMGAASLSSSAAQLARDAVKIIGASVEAVGKVVEGGHDVANAVFARQADAAQADADQAGVRLDAAQLDLDGAIDVLRQGLDSLAQGLSVGNDMLRLRDEARRAILERAV